jgi:hypothetical protein
MISQDRIQRIFKIAQKDIKSKFGLDLSLIEQVALRRCAGVCAEEQSQCEYLELNYPSTIEEAEDRFMSHYYGTPVVDVAFMGFCEDLGMGNVRKYFRISQEKAHLI